MKIAINFIGTGNYLKFFPRYYETLMEYFVPDHEKYFFVFTDGELGDDIPENIKIVSTEEDSNITKSDYGNRYKLTYHSIGGLKRFGEIKKIKDQLLEYDWYVYFDADMYCCSDVISYDDFFNDQKDYFGVQHPCQNLDLFKYSPKSKDQFPFERNPKSNAFVAVEDQTDDVYLQGCVWGGKIPKVIDLIDELDRKIIEDLENDIITVAHDESYLNKFRIENSEKFHILNPSFAKPGDIPDDYFDFPSKMIHAPEDKDIILNQ